MSGRSELIEQQAAQWLARLDGEVVTQELIDAVRAWRRDDARHEAAYLRLEAAWGKLDRLQALRPSDSAEADADLLVDLDEPEAPVVAPRPRRFVAWAAGVAALALVWLTWNFIDGPHRYSTDIGGYERVVLADGSIVQLNTNTRMRTSLRGQQRIVELLRGEATFDVAPDASRPFIVLAGTAAVRAVGTQFNVRLNDDGADVLVTEGKVVVGSAKSFSKGTLAVESAPKVAAGQGVALTSGSAVVVRDVQQDESTRALAWQSGMLLFEQQTLTEVVAEFNRYNRRQLVITDPALAGLRVGGYFRATNLDTFVSVLKSSFDVQVTAERSDILLSAALVPNGANKK